MRSCVRSGTGHDVGAEKVGEDLGEFRRGRVATVPETFADLERLMDAGSSRHLGTNLAPEQLERLLANSRIDVQPEIKSAQDDASPTQLGRERCTR